MMGGTEDNGFDTEVIRLVPGVDRAPIYRVLAASNGSGVSDQEVKRIMAGDRPDEFARLDEVRPLPWLLAGFLGLIAVTATAALLISAVQRRRHDMAILRAAGLEGRGVRAIVAAQSMLVSIIGLAFGIPLGLIAGRLVWRSVAEDLGVQVHLELPLLAVLATVVVVVLVDVVVSSIPARRAVRAHPADELRAE